jgi:hypothetical protein
MAEVDGLPWVAGLAADAYGVALGIQVNDTELLPLVLTHLPVGSTVQPESHAAVDVLFSLLRDGAGRATLYVDGFPLHVDVDLDRALDLLREVATTRVVSLVRDYVFVHAGTVVWDGRAVIVPGASGSGKTTLVAELVRAGAAYYSDEYAVIDSTGRVRPFARSLALRPASRTGTAYRSAEDLGGRVGSGTAIPALVASLRYVPDARFSVEPVSRARGAVDLLSNGISGPAEMERSISILERSLSSAQVFRGVRGEASEAARALIGLISTEAASARRSP